MHFRSPPVPPGRPPASGTGDGPDGPDGPDGAPRHVRRAFLAVNGAPLAVGIVLSCSTEATGVDVVGRLTLGVVWGALQLGVFLASVWWYEDRCARVRHHVELPPAPLPPVGAAGASSMREPGW